MNDQPRISTQETEPNSEPEPSTRSEPPPALLQVNTWVVLARHGNFEAEAITPQLTTTGDLVLLNGEPCC